MRGFEVVLGEYTRPGFFLQELRDFCQELFAYAARHQVILAGKFGTCISQAIVGVIDQDSIDVDKGIVDVAAALKLLYRHGPPVPSQSVPDLASPDIRTTRLAADRIRGVLKKVLFQSGLGAIRKRSG